MNVRVLLLTATFGVVALGAAAQSVPPTPGEPRFQVETDLVLLNVTVGDARREPEPISADRFEVFENGIPQQVTFFAGSEVPKDVAIVLDTSASMIGKMRRVQEAAIGLLETLVPGDRVTVVGVGDRVRTLQPLMEWPAQAAAAIRRATPRGNTALYNGIYTTIDDLVRHARPGEVRRPVITVFSDGEDTASIVSIDDVLDVARRSGIAIYTIAFEGTRLGPATIPSVQARDARFGLKALATETGARSFVLNRIDQVDTTFQEIADELQRQYSLGYESNNPARDGAFRRLLVRLRGLAAHARTRTGYYAPTAD